MMPEKGGCVTVTWTQSESLYMHRMCGRKLSYGYAEGSVIGFCFV